MIKRTVEISTRGTRLSVRMDQLVIRQEGETVGRVPIEDIGVLVLATGSATYSHAVLTRLMKAGAVIVACDDSHHPAGLILPCDNTLQVQRLHAQVAISKPLRKRLWQQLVRAKIAHQAAALPGDSPVGRALRAMVAHVRSGDADNREAVAARRYWSALLGKGFRRDPGGAPPNNLLNYGYMAVRAAVARAVCAAGLHPALGLHHSNRGNAFCLADDLMEPFRPLVDMEVRSLCDEGVREITRETKTRLLGVLTATVRSEGETGPLMVALERMVASLVRCFQGRQKKLEIPQPCN